MIILPLASLDCEFPRLFMFFIILSFEDNASLFFCSLSLSWRMSYVFLIIKWRLCVLGRKITEVKSCFHHVMLWYICSTWLITVDVDLDHLAEVASVRFLLFEVTSPISTTLFHTVRFRGNLSHLDVVSMKAWSGTVMFVELNQVPIILWVSQSSCQKIFSILSVGNKN